MNAPDNSSPDKGRIRSSIDLRGKLVRVFALQILFISLATLAGIYITNTIVKDVLMRGALNGEAEHYWSLYRTNPNQPLPDTDNMVGYLAVDGDVSHIPEAVRSIGQDAGYHRVEFETQEQIVHVSDFPSDERSARLYLVFESASVTDLALFFGILPLSLVLLLVYGFMLITYRMSQRAISPVVQMANMLEEFRVGAGPLDLEPMRDLGDPEVEAMVEALDHFTDRVAAFVNRERNFTRYASHELRTPVAVFKGSLDLLEKNQDRPAHEQKALRRMRTSTQDMEGLIETLLMLAREEAPPAEPVSINDLVKHQLEALSSLNQSSKNKITLREDASLELSAPPRIVQILLTNLLRNAIAYTQEGQITVTISATSVTVADTGPGMSPDELDQAFSPFYRGEDARARERGFGLGLAIVKRLSDQYRWPLKPRSTPGEGTTMEVVFNPS